MSSFVVDFYFFQKSNKNFRKKLLLLKSNLNIPNIVYNGGQIIDRFGIPMVENFISENVFKEVMNLYQKLSLYPLVYSKIMGKEKILWVKGKETKGVFNYLSARTGDDRLLCVNSFSDLIRGEIIGVTLINSDYELLSQTLDSLSQYRQISCCLQPNVYLNDEYWLEIYSSKANKYNAVKQLKNFLNVDKVISFGDNIVDLDMFRASDISVAVSNSKEQILRAADLIIGTNDQDAVAKFLIYDFLRGDNNE